MTELVFILDRSGSMGGLESDTIGGFNAMLAKQRKEAGEAVVTTVLFDHISEMLHNRIPIQAVEDLTGKDYFVRGSTALLDAIGGAIENVDNARKHTAAAYRPEHTLFVIITDGHENASTRFSLPKVRRMIEDRKELGWEFLFLGANIDAVSTAQTIGIHADYAVDYCADSEGTQLNYEAVSEAVSCMRSGAKLKPTWKRSIETDYQKRARR